VRRLLQLMIALSLAKSSGGYTAELWVAQAGSDSAAGTAASPLATIERALARDPSGHIIIGPGTYEIAKPIVLDARNTGAIIEGSKVGKVVISGAIRISGFVRLNGTTWRARSNGPVKRLWVNGRPAGVTRIPARFWHYITEPTGDAAGPDLGAAKSTARRMFHPESADMTQLAKLDDDELARVIVVLWHSWEISRHRIERIDVARNLVVLAKPAPWPMLEFGDTQRYQLENVPTTGLEPGTWYQSADNFIYYRPRPGENLARVEVLASGPAQLLQIRDTQNIVVRNLQFSYAGVGLDPGDYISEQAGSVLDSAILVDDASDIRLDRLTVSHVAGYAVWFRNHCRNSQLVQSLLEDLGGGGVRIGETGVSPPAARRTSSIMVDNNVIRRGGRLFPGSVGILVGHSSHNQVSHNDISDFYYSGISVGWTWAYDQDSESDNVIERNRIHQLGQGFLSDLGAIYTLGELSGSAIRGNLVFDVTAYPYSRAGAWGLYADAASSNILFEGNVVYRTTSGGFHENFGRDNLVKDNVFALGQDAQVELTKAEAHRSLTLTHNAIVTDGVPFFRGDWRHAHAELDHNLYFDLSGHPPFWISSTNFSDWQTLGFDRNSRYSDPGFSDPPRGDFHTRSGAPWVWQGNPPFVDAGVYGTKAWRAIAAVGITDKAPKIPAPPAGRPFNLNEDFEGTATGGAPAKASVVTEGVGDSITVTDERAHRGKHSLKFQDSDRVEFAYDPHIYYTTNYRDGYTTVRFQLYIEPGYCLSTEWRDADVPYHSGPSISIREGKVWVGLKDIAPFPYDRWVSITISAGEGRRSTGDWHLEVQPDNGQALRWTFPNADSQWHKLEWLGFVSSCRSNSRAYLDDINVEQQPLSARP
jgi:Right handed beta helix region